MKIYKSYQDFLFDATDNGDVSLTSEDGSLRREVTIETPRGTMKEETIFEVLSVVLVFEIKHSILAADEEEYWEEDLSDANVLSKIEEGGFRIDLDPTDKTSELVDLLRTENNDD